MASFVIMISSLLTLLLVAVIVWAIWFYAIRPLVPAPVNNVIGVILGIILLVFLLRQLGLLSNLNLNL